MYLTTNKKVNIILKKYIFVLFLGLQFALLSSCTNDSEKSHLSIKMTDAPGNYDAVLIDVQSVEVKGSNEKTIILNTHNRIYNLLNFSNGVDTLIATGDLDPGKISQIRLILGENNSVIKGGVQYPLSTPSAMQSGLKLAVNQTFAPGVSYILLLDFDASKSIVVTGNGTYQLKPVIRVVETAMHGSIKGSISLTDVIATVEATSNGVTYNSITNLNGQFLIAGLPAGIYNVTVTPDLPFLPITKTGVEVSVGVSTNVGLFTL